ncbi:HAD family hydrolase [Maribellus maritimus]|uniref:HAD family hydrolase n=1 Tax=Maribellus maritimus TaxID=2870838 RepID=UPI001EE9ED22|nr:HAD family phosphatase [Maribellus maritimus]MCG6190991.1 HAD family phosphatase [Maribellus maritimus]
MKCIPDNFNAVIFDMDGVLVNSEPFYFEVEKQNFEKLGLNITDEEHQTFQGTATDLMWKRLKTKYKLPHSIPELVNMTNSIVTPYFESLENIDPMPGIKELIQLLIKKNIPLAVASSSYPDVIELILKKTRLKEYFGVVVDSQMAGASKPEPDIFLLAAAKLGVLPEKCLVIEDSTNGIKAAQTAGMKVVAFAGPGSEFQDQSEADWVVKDFIEICR